MLQPFGLAGEKTDGLLKATWLSFWAFAHVDPSAPNTVHPLILLHSSQVDSPYSVFELAAYSLHNAYNALLTFFP